MRGSGFGVREKVARGRPDRPTKTRLRARSAKAGGRAGGAETPSLRVPAESRTSGIPLLIYINPRGPHGCAPFERAARTYHQLPRIHIGTHVLAAPHRTAPKRSCEVAAASPASLPRWAAWPLPWPNPHLGARGRAVRACGRPRCVWALRPRQRAERGRACASGPAAPAGLRAAPGRARPGPARPSEPRGRVSAAVASPDS